MANYTSSWSYASNVFDNVTKRNMKRMLLLATDHHDKLFVNISDPDINALYQNFLSYYQIFRTAYNQLISASNLYQSETYRFEQYISQLSSTKIKQWDIWIQNVYFDNTPEYMALLPENRTPFQSGAYDLRIAAVQRLRDILANDINLTSVYNDVNTFLGLLENCRTAQQGREGNEQRMRADLEKARYELSVQMHGNFGFLLWKYRTDTKLVETYFELQYLTTTSNSGNFQKETINANSKLSLFDGKLNDNSFVTVKNTGGISIFAFTANNPNAITPATAMEIGVGETVSFYASEISDGSGSNWLIIVNDSLASVNFEVAKE